MKKSKMVVKLSLIQMAPPKIIAFVFSIMTIGIFFIEEIHVPDNLQPSLTVFIVVFWIFFWDIIFLRLIGFSVKNQ